MQEQDVQEEEIVVDGAEPVEEEIEIVDEPEVTEASAENTEEEAEAPEEQVKPKQKNRHPAKTRINQLQREKYQAQYEAQLLREENERLKGYSQQSNQAAMAHYDQAAQLRLSQAKQALTKAQELGDIAAITEATDLLIDARSELKSIEAYKAQQQYMGAEPEKRQQQEQTHTVQTEIPTVMEDWLYQNPWCDPRSPEYDADTASEVQAYAVALEKRLARRGEANKIGSAEYYDAVNQYIRNELYEPEEQPVRNMTAQPKGLNMSAPRVPIASVNKGASSNAASPRKQVSLTADEKFMCRNMGLKESDWAKHKLEDIRIQKAKGRPYYG